TAGPGSQSGRLGYGVPVSYFGVTEIDTDAAWLNGIGSRPVAILKNERVPGWSLKNPLPLPPPRTLPFASNTTHDMLELARFREGCTLIRSPSTEPSQAGSNGLGTRGTLSRPGEKTLSERARPPAATTTSSGALGRAPEA